MVVHNIAITMPFLNIYIAKVGMQSVNLSYLVHS